MPLPAVSSTIWRRSGQWQSTWKRHRLHRVVEARQRQAVPAAERSEEFLQRVLLLSDRFVLQAFEHRATLRMPRRPGYRSTDVGARVSPAVLEFHLAQKRLETSSGSVAARSRIVRGTVVTGIPSSTARSSDGRWRGLAADRLRGGALVRSGDLDCAFRQATESQSAAGVVAGTAAGPEDRTAAIHQPCLECVYDRLSQRRRIRGCNRPEASRRSIARFPTPASSNCHRATTPYCSRALTNRRINFVSAPLLLANPSQSPYTEVIDGFVGHPVSVAGTNQFWCGVRARCPSSPRRNRDFGGV